MQREIRKVTNWMSLDWLLDQGQRSGLFLRNSHGKPLSAREAIQRFAGFCLTAGVELTQNENCEIFLRFERVDPMAATNHDH